MKLVEMTGKKFGRLTVIGSSEKRTNRGHAYWMCRCDCGTEKLVVGGNLRKNHTTSCGCRQKEVVGKRLLGKIGPLSPRWRGGRSTDKNGYIWIHDRIHPNSNKGGRVAEHVVVMGQKLGRPLLKHEEVHHLNGIRDDNSPNNLELWTKSHPQGTRVIDAIAWAKKILKTYNQFEPIENE